MSYYTEYYNVSSHDVMAGNNIKPSVLVRMMQETANHQMRDRKPTYYELFDQGKSYILIRLSCDIKDEINPYDHIEVRTWTGESKGATFIRFYQVLRDGKELARGRSEWAVVDINTGKIYRVMDIESSNYEKGEDIELEMPLKFHLDRDVEMELCGEHRVGYTECDMNLHMNNTNYHDIIWDHIPESDSKFLKGFSVRYMKGALVGETQKIYRARKDSDTWYFKTEVSGETNLEGLYVTEPIAGRI